MNKILAKSIEIERAEGLSSECIAVTVQTFAQAEATLSRWSMTAPDNGGYHKCDFKVTFEDGQTYEGRYDLSRNRADQDAPTLADHIARHLSFYAGAHKNELPGYLSHMTLADYHRMIGRLTEEQQAEYAAFLNTYQIGDVA
jgi:hypothetical protein